MRIQVNVLWVDLSKASIVWSLSLTDGVSDLQCGDLPEADPCRTSRLQLPVIWDSRVCICVFECANKCAHKDFFHFIVFRNKVKGQIPQKLTEDDMMYDDDSYS